MRYVKARNIPRCLECGDKIAYGRSDKKFCSEECKNHHHNHRFSTARSIRRRIMTALEKNYNILDKLVSSGVDAISLDDILSLGFNPRFLTSFVRCRRYCRYSCFDISYIVTTDRVFSISKIQNLSVNLQAGHDCGHNDEI